MFLELPSSDMLKIDRSKNHIIQRGLEAIKPKGLKRIAKICQCHPCLQIAYGVIKGLIHWQSTECKPIVIDVAKDDPR